MKRNMCYSLNSLNGGYIGDDIGGSIWVIKGDTRSLDNGSYGTFGRLPGEIPT